MARVRWQRVGRFRISAHCVCSGHSDFCCALVSQERRRRARTRVCAGVTRESLRLSVAFVWTSSEQLYDNQRHMIRLGGFQTRLLSPQSVFFHCAGSHKPLTPYWFKKKLRSVAESRTCRRRVNTPKLLALDLELILPLPPTFVVIHFSSQLMF